MTPYQRLEAAFARIGRLGDIGGLLQWDWSAVMPNGAAEERAAQNALIGRLIHDALTDPALEADLDAAEAEPPADPWQAANVREMRRVWIHTAAVPADLDEALTLACARCEMAWREARPASDFAAVQPVLTEVRNLVRQAAEAKADRLGLDPYDALLDQYEPGTRAANFAPVFDSLAAFLPDFIGRAQAAQARRPAPVPPPGPFPEATQADLARRFMTALGFDFNRGRLDTSLHPFCGGATNDTRITTRYAPDDYAGALMGVLHETGHALYDQGLPRDWHHQPVGEARSMAIHESQSLLMEMQACRSRAFLGWAAGELAGAYGAHPAWDPDNLFRLATRVQPDVIRVDADEVTYPAHVILRTRLEQAMIAGDLAVADLPGAWNDGLEALLGIRPPDDRRGCLQDIHWFDGAWGYFPTYTLGALTAAQMFAAARTADPDILPGLARGDFTPLVAWLRDQVHARASLLETPDLIAAATGRPLDDSAFRDHLERRYIDGMDPA